MAINGSDFLVLINTGTDEVPTYEVVGCQRDATLDETTAEIEASCKTSRNTRVLAGRYKATLTLEGLYVPDDAAYQRLQQAMRNGEFVTLAQQQDGNVTEAADAVITNLSRSFPDQDVATVSASFTIDDEWEDLGT
jgi:hypothetical protein